MSPATSAAPTDVTSMRNNRSSSSDATYTRSAIHNSTHCTHAESENAIAMPVTPNFGVHHSANATLTNAVNRAISVGMTVFLLAKNTRTYSGVRDWANKLNAK